MKKRNNELLFYIFIAGVFIVFSGLFVFLIQGFRQYDRLYMRFSLEKTLSDILAAADRGDYHTLDSVTAGIKGFGVYDHTGTRITLIGDAPRFIDPRSLETRGEFFSYNSRIRTFSLTRPLGPPRGRGHGRRRGGMGRRFVYIEAYASQFYNVYHRLFITISVLIPLVFLGILIAFVTAYRKNISYKKQMEEREKLARLGEVSRTLTHEIKNPLGAIKIQTGYLKKIIDSKHVSELGIIDQEVERLTVLTNRINDFLRDPLGSPVEIEFVSFLRELCAKYPQPVSFDNKEACEVRLFFDYHRLRSIFENIIQNALESYPDEDSNKAVSVTLEVHKDTCVVRITDRGKGLADDFESRIFDPYYTTKTKGSGIGLAITKRFLEANRGTIGFERVKEGGTAVQITLHLRRFEGKQTKEHPNSD